jgi:uncharacterized repeat protein (TIGR03847 family)
VENQELHLGLVDDFEAQSFGEPGQRTFRLLARTPEAQVSLWLEKEQLAMLGPALEELLVRVPASRGVHPKPAMAAVLQGDLEVRVGALAVGYDGERDSFTLEAGEFASPLSITAIHLLITRDQCGRVRDQIDEIVRSGRPRCPLCGRPLTGGPHFCPESNGHAHLRGE